MDAFERTLSGLGIELRAQTNVKLDTEQRPRKSPRLEDLLSPGIGSHFARQAAIQSAELLGAATASSRLKCSTDFSGG